MAGGRGGQRQRPKEPLPRNVQVSKKLSWLLRHGAQEEGLLLGEGGFANLQDVLNNRKIRSLKVSFDEVRQIVDENDKQRFTMKPVAEAPESANGNTVPSPNASEWLIRANQGHSLKIETEGLLTPITGDNQPGTAVHGTSHAAWVRIVASGGLKPMGRNHVHFASGLPPGFQLLPDGSAATDSAPVISGMRQSSTILMFLDVPKAMDSGLNLWLSDNGVILSEGNEDGIVPLDLFLRVEDRTGAGVLLENGKIIKDAPASWATPGKDKSKS
ncbi:MAG: hypothetical protein FE78DRAFT_520316 [Acidomyces sp. 'richmondensis']|nr:MAG: hypothetical protein FE78DRAFT_520316 [Acidomyces sp. 'richmondensis']